jgi:hypothetical protein
MIWAELTRITISGITELTRMWRLTVVSAWTSTDLTRKDIMTS